MYLALVLTLIAAFLPVAVRGNCTELAVKVQQDLFLISELEGKLMDLQWRVAENMVKDDLIRTLNDQIASLKQSNASQCAETNKQLKNRLEDVQFEIERCKVSSKIIGKSLNKCLDQHKQITTTKNPNSDLEFTTKTTTTGSQELASDTRSSSCVSFGYSTGIRQIYLPGLRPMTVLCDGYTSGPGWTVIQHRFNGLVDFYRNWKEYKHGFGKLKGEFFIGLQHLYRLTNFERYELYIQLDNPNGDLIHARYDDFQIGSESSRYVLRKLGEMTGTAGDMLRNHEGRKFSTYDKDDESENANLAVKYHGGWWFTTKTRMTSNLNGRYYRKNGFRSDGIYWETDYSHKKVKMMIRPVGQDKLL